MMMMISSRTTSKFIHNIICTSSSNAAVAIQYSKSTSWLNNNNNSHQQQTSTNNSNNTYTNYSSSSSSHYNHLNLNKRLFSTISTTTNTSTSTSTTTTTSPTASTPTTEKYVPTTSKIFDTKDKIARDQLIRTVICRDGPKDRVRAKHRFMIVGLGNPDKEHLTTRHNMGFLAVDQLAKLLKTQIDHIAYNCHSTTLYLELDEQVKRIGDINIKIKPNEEKDKDKEQDKEQDKDKEKKVGEEQDKQEDKEVEKKEKKDNNNNQQQQIKSTYIIKAPKKTIIELILVKPMKYMNLSGGVVRAMRSQFDVPIENILIMVDDTHLELGFVRLRGKGSAGGQNGMADIIKRLGTDKVSRLRIGVGHQYPGGSLATHVLSKFPIDSMRDVAKSCELSSLIALMWIEQGVDRTMSLTNNVSKSKIN
ncbi:Peptidyl-tRNA hydrolase [Cavenderia fasciculata]|uniref:peptidyl-tRNA hydrolase n=1 Tax=Cavenderia fasciculata TaxID=261658 RepID=F4PRR8_CACFS|nr:Peptidyl-tRNA hydrolase [Cavenderia fasciculata]EGG20567.1 Peptidyl-tRNA hydrolase [Cavenderia fasciculata]|eukprot:XP_004358417.1 Peptidyl-tRNA hydrolase [Cavenderia fasciculata]